jgi:hypothetical protein
VQKILKICQPSAKHGEYTLKEIDRLLSVRESIFADDSVITKKQMVNISLTLYKNWIFCPVPK